MAQCNESLSSPDDAHVQYLFDTFSLRSLIPSVVLPRPPLLLRRFCTCVGVFFFLFFFLFARALLSALEVDIKRDLFAFYEYACPRVYVRVSGS